MAEVALAVFWADGFWLDAAALGLALILDVALGEPPAVVHPVVYMGKLVTRLERQAPKAGRVAQFLYGLFVALLVPTLFAAIGYLVATATKAVSPALYIVVVGLLLKTCFAVRGLERAALTVQDKLEVGEMEDARAALKALVSRDTSQLTPPQAASAAIESVAENTTDSFVAPWLAFALFGLPGALAYRAVNTLDAMVGYHGRYEYLGKASARLDSALNYIPARLSALFIVVVSPLRRHSAGRALRVMAREGRTTESPNAGLTMAAMAGALGMTIEKVGHYRLGSGLRQPVARDIAESVRVMHLVAVVTCALTLIALGVHHAIS